MKRWFAVLAVLTMVAAGCGSDGSEDDSLPEETSDAADAEADASRAEGAATDLAITEVVFGDHVTITNVGDAMVSVDEMWLCNRPSYTPISVSLAPGESQTIDAASLGGLAEGGGEAALYTSNSFGDSAAIVDYVSWGGGGGRGSVASGAGIWTDGDSVDAGGAGISAPSGGDSSADWSSQ